MAVGEAVPDFELHNQFGEPVRLSELRGAPAVVVFFPFAFSSVCGQELAQLQQNLALFEEAGVRLLAVSTDSKYALRAYAQAEHLSFDLLSDFWPHGAASSEFHVFNNQLGFAERGTFFIDAQGILVGTVSSEAGTARDFGEYLKLLGRLRVTAP